MVSNHPKPASRPRHHPQKPRTVVGREKEGRVDPDTGAESLRTLRRPSRGNGVLRHGGGQGMTKNDEIEKRGAETAAARLFRIVQVKERYAELMAPAVRRGGGHDGSRETLEG